MHKIGILLFMMFGLTDQVNAQLKPYAGIEFSFCRDKMVVIQDTEDLQVSSVRSVSLGFFLGHQFNPNLKVEIGFLSKNYLYQLSYVANGYKQDFQFLNDEIYQIHVRLIPRISIYKQRLFLTNTLGFHGYYESSSAHGKSGTFLKLGTSDTLFFNFEHEKKPGFKPLVEFGLGTEYEFENGISLSLSGHYFQGFNAIKTWDYSHYLNGTGPTLNKQLINKGTYFSFTFSVLYRFGKRIKE